MVRKMLSGFLAVAAVSLSAAGAAWAEEPQDVASQGADPQPHHMGNRQPTAAEVQQMMGPMMGEMMASMLRGITKTMAEPQIAENMAVFARNYYKALIDKGFTEEQALKIVTSTGVPNMGGKS